ncbi:MAG: hypothetical protein RL391_168 [Actinomycetota bacterium]
MTDVRSSAIDLGLVDRAKAQPTGETDGVSKRNPRPLGADKRPRRELLLVSIGLGVGLTFVVFGLLSATTGRDSLGYPDAIIDISPAPNDRQVLSQTEISVDLEDGFEATLVLDGIELPTTRLEDVTGVLAEPGQQIELPPTAIYDQGNSLIRFEPTEGAPIEKYSVGEHQVTVVFWKIEDGRGSARSYSWSFEVL